MIVCALAELGVNETEHTPPESVQLVGLNAPAPPVVNETVPSGVACDPPDVAVTWTVHTTGASTVAP